MIGVPAAGHSSEAIHRAVVVDRDSVAAGDDTTSHACTIDIETRRSVTDLIAEARRACPLASIAGGRATWLVDMAGPARGCIGVVAQQWDAPKLLVPGCTTIAEYFGSAEASVFFRYWCQADPDAVFEALRGGHELPSRYGT